MSLGSVLGMMLLVPMALSRVGGGSSVREGSAQGHGLDSGKGLAFVKEVDNFSIFV